MMSGLWHMNGEVAELQSFTAEEMKPRFPLDPDPLTAPEALALTGAVARGSSISLIKYCFLDIPSRRGAAQRHGESRVCPPLEAGVWASCSVALSTWHSQFSCLRLPTRLLLSR